MVLDAVMPLLRCHTVVRARSIPYIAMHSKTYQTRDCIESVSEITGTAVPMCFEAFVADPSDDAIASHAQDVARYLELANHKLSQESGYLFKVMQIYRYDWMCGRQMHEALRRVEACVRRHSGEGYRKHVAFETECNIVTGLSYPNGRGAALSGRTDIRDDAARVVYEVKCVNDLDDVHVVQLALYMYIIECAVPTVDDDAPLVYTYVLFNVNDGHEVVVTASRRDLRAIAKYLLFPRALLRRTDAEFLEECDAIRRGIATTCRQNP
jgi:hypothetical protein